MVSSWLRWGARTLRPWRRTPSVLQMEAAECGAACLAMILARHGRHEGLDTVRQACGASRDGVSAAALVEAARGFGLMGEAYRVEIEDLGELPLPQILFWNFNHYVVLEKVRDSVFTIIDPANGRRRVAAPEMGRSFTGLSLAFEPGPSFRRARGSSGLGRALREALAGSWGAAASIMLATILLTVVGILVPSLTRIFVDEYLSQGRREWLTPLLIGIGMLAALRVALTWAQAQGSLFLQTRINGLISARLVWTVLRLPFSFITSRSAAEVSTRMALAGQIAGTASGPVLKIANSLVMVIGYGLAMLAYSPMLTGLVLIVLVANLGLLWAVNRVVAETSADAQMMAGQAHGIAIQGISMLEESRATGTVPLLFRRLLDAYVDETNAQQRSLAVTQAIASIPFFCNLLLGLIVLGVGSFLVMRAELTVGGLLAFQMLAQMFAAPLQSVLGLGSAVLSASGSVVRTRDLLDGQQREDGLEAAFTGKRLQGQVALVGVGFAYPGRPPLFHDLSCRFEPGSLTLILGESGVGKTTLAMLLAGVLTPSAGTLRWDGDTAATIPSEVFRHSLGLVEQTPFFAAGTVRDALTLWDPGHPTSALREALRLAEMEERIFNRPGGVGARIGEGGAGFSGGELQRLGFARALVAGPRVLIVDDATTALDAATEARLLANLRMTGMTVIMTTTRAALASHFDTLLYLADGRLLADPQAAA